VLRIQYVGAESIIQRVYPIKIITVLVPDAPPIDYVVRVKKESVDGIIRPLADSVSASILNKMITVSGQPPVAFTRNGRPAIIYIAPMEKLSLFVVNLRSPDRDTTLSFQLLAEKGLKITFLFLFIILLGVPHVHLHAY